MLVYVSCFLWFKYIFFVWFFSVFFFRYPESYSSCFYRIKFYWFESYSSRSWSVFACFAYEEKCVVVQISDEIFLVTHTKRQNWTKYGERTLFLNFHIFHLIVPTVYADAVCRDRNIFKVSNLSTQWIEQATFAIAVDAVDADDIVLVYVRTCEHIYVCARDGYEWVCFGKRVIHNTSKQLDNVCVRWHTESSFSFVRQ